ncbi:MAG TPA: hypothetical protein VGK58_17740 [Lacipirellulaceae bacterium]
MPDVNRPKPAAGRPAQSRHEPPVDPRVALAQQYLKKAEAELAEKEAAQPRSRRRAHSGGAGPRPFSLSIAPSTLIHIVLAALAFTFAALAVTLTYHMLHVNFVVGRVIALPSGIIAAAALSYLSVCFLGVIESTSIGHTNVDALEGDWRDWFWTLPATVGMLAVAAAVGWILSLVLPINVWLLIAICALLLYPVFQLSSLEAGSPVVPLSLPVVQSISRCPLAWFVVYAISFAVVGVLSFIGRSAWRDPPYATILALGPLVAVALFFYAWLLGQLAHLIGTENKS